MTARPVVLIIRDGWGFNPNPKGNSVYAAKTPTIDRLKCRYPWTLLDASGEPVGLPDGYQGSSEVGHLNMGAGRIVIQELKRIDDGLRDGTLFESGQWKRLVDNWKSNQGKLHLMGLLQDEGVHAHQEHLFKIMRRARGEFPGGGIVIHPFLDGRDTPPRSCGEYIAKLQKVMAEIGCCSVGTVMGRYYGMDRSKNWALTDAAYDCIVSRVGRRGKDPLAVVKESYAKDKTPDGTEMVDEYIPPHVLDGYDGVKDGDSVLHTNYRQDRAIQLSMAFVDPGYPGKLREKPNVVYVGLTRYYDQFPYFILGAMGADGGMDNLFGEVVSKAGFRQLRIAETQKFRHVTSFFNGKSTTPYQGEDQVEIKGRFDPATFASHPEMEAEFVTGELLERIKDNPYRAIIVNFANGDMVGHTGDPDAARIAVETVDRCIGELVPRLLELDAQILITADHGNAEQMVDYETGMTKTSHTLYPVELIYVAKDSWDRKLVERGKLSDIAPTMLKLLGLAIPKEMTSEVLISGLLKES
ncbi:MAG: 2,3-bisphosphoglycerate-independent phosphoglycerate mutase, partial [Planctomycetota bacterium]|nr:2,3-bisphosphoglycerate-independent phosphoglycerate mutase [Planctomycetota bacterium]